MKRLKFGWDINYQYYIVWNKKNEKLGSIFYYKPWKCWCYQQYIKGLEGQIIMSWDCLEEIVEFMKRLQGGEEVILK